MRTTEKERLLHDVLQDESYRAFRADLRADLLGQVRRQRAARQQRRLLALAACLPVALGVFLLRPPRHAPSPPAAPSTVGVVRTAPLGPDNIVSTRQAQTIRSRPAEPAVAVLATVEGRLGIIRTSPGALQHLNDQQLLDLFKGQAVALVTLGPGQRQLLLPGQEQPDADALP